MGVKMLNLQELVDEYEKLLYGKTNFTPCP